MDSLINPNCPHCDGTGVEPRETSAYPPEPCSECRKAMLARVEQAELVLERKGQLDAKRKLEAENAKLRAALIGLGDSLGCVDECFERGLRNHSPACEVAKATLKESEGAP